MNLIETTEIRIFEAKEEVTAERVLRIMEKLKEIFKPYKPNELAKAFRRLEPGVDYMGCSKGSMLQAYLVVRLDSSLHGGHPRKLKEVAVRDIIELLDKGKSNRGV